MDEPRADAPDTLFDLVPEPSHPSKPVDRGRARLQRADRAQVQLRPVDLDGLLPADHRARLVWEVVGTLDLSAFHDRIRATEGHSGRPAIDPAILIALWLYATLDGVGSARALERLCAEHDAYRWLAGGVGVNHHTLADFRVELGDLLDGLLVQTAAALLATGEVPLARVAQDGIRVRAAAGSSSYRTRRGLERALADAQAQVATLRSELTDDPAATSRRVAAARERAAREHAQRLDAALEALRVIETTRRRRIPRTSEPRASTTDPEARVMRMADGGYRPAYNCQISADVESGAVVGVAIHDSSDAGQLLPAVERLIERLDRRPAEILADGGYATLADIDALTRAGTIPYVPPDGRSVRNPRGRRPYDTPVVIAWRERMATAEAQAVYRLRAATIEWVNALARNRGLQQFRVRGRAKARAVLLWFGLAHNLGLQLARRPTGGI